MMAMLWLAFGAGVLIGVLIGMVLQTVLLAVFVRHAIKNSVDIEVSAKLENDGDDDEADWWKRDAEEQ